MELNCKVSLTDNIMTNIENGKRIMSSEIFIAQSVKIFMLLIYSSNPTSEIQD